MRTATLGRDALRVLAASIEAESADLPACQWALALDGEVVAGATIGAAGDARFAVFSVTKALTGATVWLFPELAPHRRVAEFTAGFDDAKRTVTVAHLLTHTAGFPRAPMRPEQGADPSARRARFATWRLDWPPGTQTEYHASSAHWVLADLIEQVSGLDFREVVRRRVLEPLALGATSLGADDRPVVLIEYVGTPPDGAPAPIPDLAGLDFLNAPEARAAGIPGGGAVSTAADIALLYQALLHNRPGVWDPHRLADGTGVVRNRLTDPWTGVAANRTLGLAVAGDDGFASLRQFGRATGPRAFGAPGAGGQLAWADPDSGISFCFLTSGLDRNAATAFLRADRIATAAARCVT